MTHLTQQPSQRGWHPWEFSLFLSFFFTFLSLPGKVGHPATLLIVLPFISPKKKTAERERWRNKGHSLTVFALSLLTGGRSQFCHMGEIDGQEARQPHWSREHDYTDVQTNICSQGNGRASGVEVGVYLVVTSHRNPTSKCSVMLQLIFQMCINPQQKVVPNNFRIYSDIVNYLTFL